MRALFLGTIGDPISHDELASTARDAPALVGPAELIGVDRTTHRRSRRLDEEQVLCCPRFIRSEHRDDRRATEVQAPWCSAHHLAEPVVPVPGAAERLVGRVRREQTDPCIDVVHIEGQAIARASRFVIATWSSGVGSEGSSRTRAARRHGGTPARSPRRPAGERPDAQCRQTSAVLTKWSEDRRPAIGVRATIRDRASATHGFVQRRGEESVGPGVSAAKIQASQVALTLRMSLISDSVNKRAATPRTRPNSTTAAAAASMSTRIEPSS